MIVTPELLTPDLLIVIGFIGGLIGKAVGSIFGGGKSKSKSGPPGYAQDAGKQLLKYGTDMGLPSQRTLLQAGGPTFGQTLPRGTTRGLFGNLLGGSGGFATAALPTEARTAALDPFGHDAQSVGGIDWGGFGASPFKANIDEALRLFGDQTKRDYFGDSGIGGLFGAGGSALARSGLMSSSAGERLAQRLGGDLSRTQADYGNRLLGEGLRTYGTFETSDLERLARERMTNRDRSAGIDKQNQNIASMERYGDLQRAADIAKANAARRQAGIDRQVRTRAGLFDTLFNERAAERARRQGVAQLPIDILTKVMSGSGTTSSSTGANPFLSNLMGGLGTAAGNKVIDYFGLGG